MELFLHYRRGNHINEIKWDERLFRRIKSLNQDKRVNAFTDLPYELTSFIQDERLFK